MKASIWMMREVPFGVVANVLDCDMIVSEFKLQSHYNVHCWSNTLGKGMNTFISPDIGKIVPLKFFLRK